MATVPEVTFGLRWPVHREVHQHEQDVVELVMDIGVQPTLPTLSAAPAPQGIRYGEGVGP